MPVVVADFQGERYLVAMLGPDANWVRNAHVAGRRSYGGTRTRAREPTSPSTGARLLAGIDLAPQRGDLLAVLSAQRRGPLGAANAPPDRQRQPPFHGFFSARVGCQTDGFYGVDLAGLGIRHSTP